MRIFVLGAGGTGSLLAHLLTRQGHTVWCGDRDITRAQRFLGKKSTIEVIETNARNLWSIVRAARGANLIVNASPAVFNEIILRAALRLGIHYMDLNAHLTRSPFKPEQYRYHKRFVAKNRTALICAGVAPGLTNLLAKRGSELLDSSDEIHFRLFESTESKDPISTWSADGVYDAAISNPRIYRHGKFAMVRRFAEREKFRFPAPIGEATVYLAAQDEVCLMPRDTHVRDVDAKIIRRGILENARFAAAVLVRGAKDDQPLLVRWDASFPTLYQIRQRGMISTPISYATAHMAALFVKNFPRDSAGVISPSELPLEKRRAILAAVKSQNIRLSLKITRLKKKEENEDF
jgi:hypothetical protein